MPFALRTRQAVRELLIRDYGVKLTEPGVGVYLKRWGFTPQNPLKRAAPTAPKAARRLIGRNLAG